MRRGSRDGLDDRQPHQRSPGPARQCTRCGGLGTHYLTCPLLRLPRGYPFSDDRILGTSFTAGKQYTTRRPATDDVSSAEAGIYRLLSRQAQRGRTVRRGDSGQ